MILDTDILIDIKRGRILDALASFESLPAYPYLSGFAAMEFIFGCRSATELREAEVFLAPFPIVWPDHDDLRRAMSYGRLKLTHGIGVIDSLTAALSVGRDDVLATFNVKHFNSVPDLRTIQPYNHI